MRQTTWLKHSSMVDVQGEGRSSMKSMTKRCRAFSERGLYERSFLIRANNFGWTYRESCWTYINWAIKLFLAQEASSTWTWNRKNTRKTLECLKKKVRKVRNFVFQRFLSCIPNASLLSCIVIFETRIETKKIERSFHFCAPGGLSWNIELINIYHSFLLTGP